MDDLIKLLQQLMSQKPRPKGGIADTAEGVEFLGKTLSKEQKGNFMVVSSRLTDASRLKTFSIGNVGRDKRFNLISDYEKDLLNEFNRTVEFLKANPDIRLSQAQKDNIFYNLGVLRRISAEKNTLEKGIIEDGKKPSNVRDMEGNVLDPNEPIMGGTQVKESYKKDELIPIKSKKILDDRTKDISKGDPTGEVQKEVKNFVDDNFGDLLEELEKVSKPKKAGKGQFTKAEYLIQRLRNTIKENPDDAYVQENFPNFIKELEANPDLAKNENVFRELGGDLPSDQKITVYDDDTLDFARLKPTKSFKLNKEQFQKDFNVSDEEVEKILALSPEEQQKVLQEYIDKDFGQQIELSDFDVTDKEPNAKGGRVGFSQGTPGRGLGSLTPQQKFYTDKLIRDNMEAIREDMSLYFDEDDRTEFQKFLDSLTKKDIYGTYDEKKGYDSVFKEYFETRDGKNFVFEGPGDNEIDRKGLLELIDKSTRPRTFDYDVTKKQRKEFEI
jgi:hypothetical protein